jgi:hypothetical protein
MELGRSVALLVAVLVVGSHAASAPAAGEAPREGQPADIAASAYQYRADRAADQNDPESWMLVLRHAGVPLDRPGAADVKSPAVRGVIRALLWEEVRQVRTVEVVWADDRHPDANGVALMYADSDQWWRTGTRRAVRADVSPYGRKHTFTVPKDTFGLLLCVVDADGKPKDASTCSVPEMRVYGPDTWKRMEIEIEWGFEAARAGLDYSGSVAAYDGVIGDVKPLAGEGSTAPEGAVAWKSAGKAVGRRGVRLSLLYMGRSPWRKMWPNAATVHDLARTIITVRTKSGSFSFLAADLENGPILAPEHGFFVRATAIEDPPKPAPKTQPAVEPKAPPVARELLTTKLNKLLNSADLSGWGTGDTPFVVSSPRDAAVTAGGNIVFPARGVAVHPGTGSDVAIAWRSPMAGKVAVAAKVAGLQTGGDGIVWRLVKESGKKTAVDLCKGETAGGGKQASSERPEAKALEDLTVEAGDVLLLIVNRRGSHSCDSTGVEFVIREKGGKERTWDLAKDVVENIQAGNPHADSHGNADAWSFCRAAGTAGTAAQPAAAPGAHEPPFEMQSKAGSAAEFVAELKAKGLTTIRQRVQQAPEQSWEGAMNSRFGPREFAAMPVTGQAPPMQVEVPCPWLTAQWKLGCWHNLRTAKRTPKGEVRLADHPYAVLAQETFQMVYALDLAGMHKEAGEALDLWLDLPLKASRPAGMFSDANGVFCDGGYDPPHAMGSGTIGWVMGEHYRLTGDKEWLKAKAPRMKMNAEWILRQRRLLCEIIPGGQRLWAKGLQPAHQLTPDAGGFFSQFYASDSYYWLVVRALADTLADIEPGEAAKLSAEADAYRADILAAVERSVVLSPVVAVRDGTYRSFIPPVPNARGPISLAWMWARKQSINHWDGIAWDISMGAMNLLHPSRLLTADDVRAQGHMDVLEDRFLLENRKVYMRTPNYDPSRDWFQAGWHHQCAYERNPQVHLAWDNVAAFLRGMLNQYAAHIVPGPYTFNEHSTRGPADKPFEEAGFMERFRDMLVMEDGGTLWIARGTPRVWLEQGKRIAVKDAPTYFGPLTYEIVSDVDNGKIAATVEIPSRNPPKAVFLRFRHPKTAPIKSVTVNGKLWNSYNRDKETIILKDLTGTVTVTAQY